MVILACVPVILAASLAYGQAPAEALQSAGTEESRLLRVAGELFEQKSYPAAAKQYQDFIQRYPKDLRHGEALMMFAESLYRQALAEASTRPSAAPSPAAFREAAKAYESALKAIPDDDLLKESAAFRLAEIEFNLRQHENAIKAFEKLLAEHPGGLLRGEVRLLQAQSLLSLQQAPEAARLLEAVLQDQPRYEDDPRMHLAYGVALFSVGNSSKALTYLDRLDAPLAHLYAGRCLLGLGKPLVAIEHFLRIDKADPDGPYRELSRYLTAESFFAAKDYTSAVQAYEQFTRDYPQSPLKPGAIFKIGFAQYELQDYLAARGSFQSVLQLASQNEFAMLSLYMTAESFLKENRLKEAGFAYADMAASYDGGLAGNAQFKLAWTHLQSGDLAAAETAAQQMLVKQPSHPLAPLGALLLGNVLTQHKRYGDAVLAYQRALDMLPANPLPEARKAELREASLALLNRANLLAQDYGRLVSGYRYVMAGTKPSLSPWRAATLLFIAEGYFRQGLQDQALALYREIVKSFPASPEAAYAVDGMAWSLFQKRAYAEAEAARRKLEEYKTRPKVAPAKTALVDGALPDGLFTDSEFETAAILFNRKQYLEALAAYESFEKAHPSHPAAADAAVQAGWCAYRLEYYGQAIKTWERVETAYPQSQAAAKAAWATADTYFRAGQYEKAIAVYRRILQSYPDEPALEHARLRIAQSYYNGRDVLKAIAAFEELLRAAPESPEAASVLDFLTQILYRDDAQPHALAALERLGQEQAGSPLAARARLRVARYDFENRDYAKAVTLIEPLTTRLTEAGELADAEFMLAEAYYNLQKYKDAAWAYDRFTTNYPGDERYVPALFHLGASRFKLEEYPAAAEAFQSLVKRSPKASHAPVALFNSALAFRKLGKWEEAALALKTYRKEYPEAARTSNAAAELLAVYEEHHQYAAAVAAIQEERAGLPEDDARRLELTYRLGENLSALGQEEEALKAYQALAGHPSRRDPFRLSALAKLAEHYEGRGLWSPALAAYEDLARNATRADWAQAAEARAQNAREKFRQGQVHGSSATARDVSVP